MTADAPSASHKQNPPLTLANIVGIGLIAAIGLAAYLIAADLVISGLFGMEYRNNSAGMRTLVVAMQASPVYLVVFAAGFPFIFRRLRDLPLAAICAGMAALVLGVAAACTLWIALGGGTVLQSF